MLLNLRLETRKPLRKPPLRKASSDERGKEETKWGAAAGSRLCGDDTNTKPKHSPKDDVEENRARDGESLQENVHHKDSEEREVEVALHIERQYVSECPGVVDGARESEFVRVRRREGGEVREYEGEEKERRREEDDEGEETLQRRHLKRTRKERRREAEKERFRTREE